MTLGLRVPVMNGEVSKISPYDVPGPTQSSQRLPPRHAGGPAAPNRAEEDFLSLGWGTSRLLEGLQPGKLASHGGPHHLLQRHR